MVTAVHPVSQVESRNFRRLRRVGYNVEVHPSFGRHLNSYRRARPDRVRPIGFLVAVGRLQ